SANDRHDEYKTNNNTKQYRVETQRYEAIRNTRTKSYFSFAFRHSHDVIFCLPVVFILAVFVLF
ncbi:MAG: hypothetical protein AAFQ04_03430, partial [Pseudomonadota bacterium]